MSLKQYILVGGSSGIGLQLSKQLCGSGYLVHNISRGISFSDFEHPNLINHKNDILDNSIELPSINGPVAGLIYCPGSINLKPFRSLKAQDFINDLNINLIGAIRVIQHFLPLMQMSESSSVILFSSIAAQTGLVLHSSIAASKAAVEGFGRSLAAELAPKIKVNIIAPSLTNTPLAVKLINNESKLSSAGERHPLKRIGNPEEIASLANFLLSDQASWITGQTYTIDGGISTLK